MIVIFPLSASTLSLKFKIILVSAATSVASSDGLDDERDGFWLVVKLKSDFPNKSTELFIYGGGAFNKLLVNGIIDLTGIKKSNALKNIVDEKNLESTAFAWLAYMRQKEILVNNRNPSKSKKGYLLGNIH